MNSAIAALLGAIFGFGVFCLIRGVVGTPVDDTSSDPPRRALPTVTVDHLSLRITAAVIAAVATAALTRWPVGAALAGAGGFAAPSLLGQRARREASQAHLEAI